MIIILSWKGYQKKFFKNAGLWENTDINITFPVIIEKEVIRIDKTGEEAPPSPLPPPKKKKKLFVDSERFMASSL